MQHDTVLELTEFEAYLLLECGEVLVQGRTLEITPENGDSVSVRFRDVDVVHKIMTTKIRGFIHHDAPTGPLDLILALEG